MCSYKIKSEKIVQDIIYKTCIRRGRFKETDRGRKH